MTKQNTCSSTFSKCETNHLTDTLFLSKSGIDVSRTDVVKYPSILKIDERMRSLFWVPEEISINKDTKDYRELPEHAQAIFTETLLRATMLDSIQGRGPSSILLPICTNPELELAITSWDFFESIHSKSYSYIIKNVYTNPSEIFDKLHTNAEILKCADSISEFYDKLAIMNAKRLLNTPDYNEFEHKTALYLCLVAINALESIRFYVAFATFFSFAENDTLQGTAKILQMIARDESLHVGLTTTVLDRLVDEDSDYAIIKNEYPDKIASIYNDVIQQETEWSNYIMSKGSLVGLNKSMLCDYMHYLGRQKMRQFGFTENDMHFPVVKTNPLPWMDNWLDLSKTQSAPQEIEQINYRAGAVDLNDTEISFDF